MKVSNPTCSHPPASFFLVGLPAWAVQLARKEDICLRMVPLLRDQVLPLSCRSVGLLTFSTFTSQCFLGSTQTLFTNCFPLNHDHRLSSLALIPFFLSPGINSNSLLPILSTCEVYCGGLGFLSVWAGHKDCSLV